MYEIYTDASWQFQENRGAWAFVYVEQPVPRRPRLTVTRSRVKNFSTKFVASGSAIHSLELLAATKAISWAHQGATVQLFSDSMIVVDVTNRLKNVDWPAAKDLLKALDYKEIKITVTHLKRNTCVYNAYANYVCRRVALQTSFMHFAEYEKQWLATRTKT